MLGKRCSTARVACAYSLIVACEPGEAPCPGASKHAADSPFSSTAATTVDIAVLSAPHPWSARTVGSSLPQTYAEATLGTPASSTRLAPSGQTSSGKLPRPRVLTKMFVCTYPATRGEIRCARASPVATSMTQLTLGSPRRNWPVLLDVLKTTPRRDHRT